MAEEKKKPSIFLDVDPSIIENKLKIASPSSTFEEDINNMFSQPDALQSIKPIPGFCLKTRDKSNDEKIFINVCHSSEVPSPRELTEIQLTKLLNSSSPSSYRVPLSIGVCHLEKDNSGQPARVYDVLVGSDFFGKLRESRVFHLFFLTLVFEGVSDKFDLELDSEGYVIMKNKKQIGPLRPHSIRNRDMNAVGRGAATANPLIQEIPARTRPPGSREMDYHILREPAKGRVKYLIGEFKIDRSVKGEEITLEVGEDRIVVETMVTNQLVDVFVPYIIKQDSAKAVLNQNTSVLTLTMVATDPIIPTGDK